MKRSEIADKTAEHTLDAVTRLIEPIGDAEDIAEDVFLRAPVCFPILLLVAVEILDELVEALPDVGSDEAEHTTESRPHTP